jgi:hypothetical protein
MSDSPLKGEPYEISVRFYVALWSNALRLEADADKDELAAASLQHPGHLQRQKLLVQAQRQDAARLRNFLADTRIRSK